MGAAQDQLRRNIPRSMKGPGWDAFIEALATAIQPALDDERNVFDNLFLTSAVGKYLDRRAALDGIGRPRGVMMGDLDFRKLAVAVRNRQLTTPALLGIIECFYDMKHTRAWDVTVAGPFALNDGDSITFEFDKVDSVTTIFQTADFQNIAAATVLEVAAVLNRSFAAAGSRALAQVIHDFQSGDDLLYVFSGTAGLRSSVMARSGSALAVLGFTGSLQGLLSHPGASWVASRGVRRVEVAVPAVPSVGSRTPVSAGYVIADAATTGSGIYIRESTGEGLSLTATASTTTADIEAGTTLRLLTLADGSSFPDSAGYVVFGYGFSYQTGPVPVLGKAGTDVLVLDPSFVFGVTIPSGAKVRLLVSNEAPTLGDDEKGYFWLTPSAAGRVACQGFLDRIFAAGYTLVHRTIYPSDVGLGNAGCSTLGDVRLSDLVSIYGGDDLDNELLVAREG